MAEACDCGNETSDSVKFDEILGSLQKDRLLKQDFAPRNYLIISK